MQEQDAINQIKKNGYVLLNDVLDNKLCEMYKNMLNQDVEKYSKTQSPDRSCYFCNYDIKSGKARNLRRTQCEKTD